MYTLLQPPAPTINNLFSFCVNLSHHSLYPKKKKSNMGTSADNETNTCSDDESSTCSGSDAGIMEVEGEEEDQTSGPMKEQAAQNGAEKALSTAPTLSKSWAIEHAHVPIFTGGKICPFSLKHEENLESLPVSCLFLPVKGDLAIVDALRGTKLGAIRESSGTLNRRSSAIDEHEDDDGGLDGDAITAYAFSNTQNILITCTQNHMLQQYTLKLSHDANDHPKTVSVALEKTWGRSGHSLPVVDMEFHKSGVFVATASVDGTCRIFDLRGGHVTHIYRPLAGGSGGGSGRLSVTSIRWMDDTSHLVIAIGRDDGSIAIHDLRDKDMKRVVVLRDHLSAVTSMDWWWKSNTGTNREQSSFYPSVFVSAGRDAVINLWQLSDKQQSNKKTKKSKNQNSDMADAGGGAPAYHRARTLPLYEEIEGMVLMPNEHDTNEDGCMRIATAGSKGAVRLWMSKLNREGDISALEKIAEQPATQAYGKERGGHLRLGLMNTQAQNMGMQLVVADSEHCLSFLSVSGRQDENLTTERTVVGFNDEVLDLKIIPSAAANSEASHIVVATNSAQVRIFDMDTFACHVLDGHTATVLCVDVSPCGRYIATCGKDNRMCLWHTESRKCIATAVGHTLAVGGAALSRKKGRLKRADMLENSELVLNSKSSLQDSTVLLERLQEMVVAPSPSR
jgi:U3 small nucleolar RNA-associated protein 13